MTDVIAKGINVEVSDDGYEAYIVVEEPDLQPTDIQAALEANGIVYGLDNDAASGALNNIGKQVLVATGARHTDGKDGWFERIQKREQTEAEKKFGITNVYVGDVFGVIHKPTVGSVGVDVFGKKIQPKQGRNINIFTGPNIKRNETDDQITLEASADGDLRINNTNIEILTEHIIREDVDYSDGELEFAGSLRILGDVKGSGSLKVGHNLLIQGSVEDAKIIAGGDVIVRGSFVGRGDGLIRTSGNVEVNVVLNQMIEAGGSITITKECVNAHLIAVDSILGHHAVIMGGVITAGEHIDVRTLGGELYSTTKAKVGIRELLMEDARAIDKEIEIQTKSSEQLKSEIYLLVRDRIDGKNFTTEKVDRLKLLQAKLQEHNESIKQLTTKKQETTIEMKRKRSPKLTVTGTVHQSVIAEINGVRFALKQSYSNVTFEELKQEIIRTKNF